MNKEGKIFQQVPSGVFHYWYLFRYSVNHFEHNGFDYHQMLLAPMGLVLMEMAFGHRCARDLSILKYCTSLGYDLRNENISDKTFWRVRKKGEGRYSLVLGVSQSTTNNHARFEGTKQLAENDGNWSSRK